MLEVTLDHKNGKVWDISGIVSDLSWSTTRTGRPANIDFTLIQNGIFQDRSFSVNNGDIVQVRKDGYNFFHGYVFSIKTDQDAQVSIKAYDQVRYLLFKQMYKFKNTTATDIIKKIAADFQLKVGRLDDSKYKIPSLLEDGGTLLDIIEKAITLTLVNTQRHYVFFDDFGTLSLRLVDDLLPDFYIGEGSLLTEYDYTRDIDSDTYNLIKLYRDNKQTNRRDVYQAQDSANIAKWGILQLYQSIDENMNKAQINAMLTQLAQLKNRETRSLKLNAIGDIRVRAGTYARIHIASLGLDMSHPMLVDECIHKFDGADHSMSLTLKVI